jgi:2-polyprenyl-3-methyl-5-hydroxy-6-metoxy-1,4-benzoquinol methylase
MLALVELGFDVHGIELNSDVARAAEVNTGLPVHTVDDFWRQSDLYFDAIYLGDVLEHLSNPRELLVNLSRRLKQNGILFLEGPLEINPSIVNLAIALTQSIKNLFGLSEEMSSPPSHLFMTNANQFIKFLESVDWKLEIVNVKLSDSGWPYSRGGGARPLIASISRFISRIPLLNRYLGNRFSIVLKMRNV